MGELGKAEKREERRPIEDYLELGEEELYGRLIKAKRALGERVVVLGHHYQRDDVICHADLTGDSFKLAAMAAQLPDADGLSEAERERQAQERNAAVLRV